MINTNTEFGRRVVRRLKEEQIIWLITVDKNGMPQPRPVWFLWDGETFLIYSQPDTYKLEHVRNNPRVSLHLDSDGQGGDIVVFAGEARIAEEERPADEMPAYADKYQQGFASIGMTPGEFARAYSVPLRIRPINLRGY